MYRQYSIAYQTALQNYNACTDNSMRSHLKDGLHDAWQTWEELGYRDEIDLARQTIDSITRKGLLSRRENAKHTLLTSKLNDPMYGDYLQTSVFPSNALEQQSWTKVSFDASNLSQNTSSSPIRSEQRRDVRGCSASSRLREMQARPTRPAP